MEFGYVEILNSMGITILFGCCIYLHESGLASFEKRRKVGRWQIVCIVGRLLVLVGAVTSLFILFDYVKGERPIPKVVKGKLVYFLSLTKRVEEDSEEEKKLIWCLLCYIINIKMAAICFFLRNQIFGAVLLTFPLVGTCLFYIGLRRQAQLEGEATKLKEA